MSQTAGVLPRSMLLCLSHKKISWLWLHNQLRSYMILLTLVDIDLPLLLIDDPRLLLFGNFSCEISQLYDKR